MNIVRILEEIDGYYLRTRQRGHTTALMKGMASPDVNGVIVYNTPGILPYLRKLMTRPVPVLSLDDVSSGHLRRLVHSIGFDNDAIREICMQSLAHINELNAQITTLKAQK